MKMNVKQIRDKIEQIDSIPTIPVVVRKLLKTVDSPSISLGEIGDIITKDQALTAKLLKMVNSPIYGFPGRISSVSQTLILLGLNVVKGMLLSISVFEMMEKTMVGLWEHSLCTALAARAIAIKKDLKDPEEIMVSALLHDIGKVALRIKFPEEYETALSESEKKGKLIRESEESVFSISHAEAGGWLTEKWFFPRSLIEPIAYHHRPILSKQVPQRTAIVHVADILVRARGVGFGGDNLVPPVNTKVWEDLSLSKSDIRDIMIVIDDTASDAEGILL
ncbi:MAG: HDOD domain-containing protein [Thermodesulfovibrionales bacterium]